MFFKKNFENIIYISTYIITILFIVFSKNSLFSHWADILDQDVTLIYNSLLVASNLDQEYLDHPAHTTFFLLNVFYKIGYLFNIIDFKDISGLLQHPNKHNALQNIHNFSQIIHVIYSLFLILILKRVIYNLTNDHVSAFFLSLIFLVSPSNIFLIDIIRSEILSLILIFLFYICLENTFKKNIIYIICAGFFFVLSLLAKVQIILSLPFLLFLFFTNNNSKKSLQKIPISNKTNIILNILLIFFIIYIIDNFFYKRIDKIFFLLIFIFMLFVFAKIEKNISHIKYSNISLILFFLGCSGCILLFKFFQIIGFSKFHPALIDLITSPISTMSSISTGYSIGTADNLEYVFRIKKFFFQVLSSGSSGTKNEFKFLLDKFNVFTYFVSMLYITYFFIKEEYQKSLIIFILLFLNIFVILIFNFRPYFFYDIYILPFNIIILSLILNDLKYKRIFAIFFVMIYLSLNYSEITNQLNQKRLNGIFNINRSDESKNMNFICQNEEIINVNSYMRYWHRNYDEKFLRDLCNSYYEKIN